MTYFTFLGLFLVLPILMLLARLKYDARFHRVSDFITTDAKIIGGVIGLHILLAVVWTTPWDNYLVATKVWWYDLALVNGMTIGYVPIEEYTFFVLQPIMTALWLVFLMPRLYQPTKPSKTSYEKLRARATFMMGIVWCISLGLLVSEYKQFTYLGLELMWALPPIMLQFAFGADILWKQRRLVVFTILSSTLFLSIADLIAIGMGTWTIDPTQSTGILLAGILPIEELLFFLSCSETSSPLPICPHRSHPKMLSTAAPPTLLLQGSDLSNHRTQAHLTLALLSELLWSALDQDSLQRLADVRLNDTAHSDRHRYA